MPETVLTINGKRHSVDADPDTPLLWVIRENAGLTGTKFGCGGGFCRACTVHVGGNAVPSCQMKLSQVNGRPITTIEGLSSDPTAMHAVQKAWVEEDVPQCGYCQSGQIMAAAALLAKKPNPTDADIDGIANICRCGTYSRIRRAIHRAAKEMKP